MFQPRPCFFSSFFPFSFSLSYRSFCFIIARTMFRFRAHLARTISSQSPSCLGCYSFSRFRFRFRFFLFLFIFFFFPNHLPYRNIISRTITHPQPSLVRREPARTVAFGSYPGCDTAHAGTRRHTPCGTCAPRRERRTRLAPPARR